MKKGDKVRLKGNYCFFVGEIIEIDFSRNLYVVRWDTGIVDYRNDQEIELINNLNTPMNLKEKFLTSLKKEPEKSFRKAEITNGDDLLTEAGKDVFLCWLLQKNGSEFKKEVVDDILKEEEEKD